MRSKTTHSILVSITSVSVTLTVVAYVFLIAFMRAVKSYDEYDEYEYEPDIDTEFMNLLQNRD